MRLDAERFISGHGFLVAFGPAQRVMFSISVGSNLLETLWISGSHLSQAGRASETGLTIHWNASSSMREKGRPCSVTSRTQHRRREADVSRTPFKSWTRCRFSCCPFEAFSWRSVSYCCLWCRRRCFAKFPPRLPLKSNVLFSIFLS